MQTENDTASAVHTQASEAKVAPVAQASEPSSQGPIRFASTKKPLGRTISYVIRRLRDDHPVVLQGTGLAMTRVLAVAGIARDRVGGIHQHCEFFAYDIKNSPMEGTGI